MMLAVRQKIMNKQNLKIGIVASILLLATNPLIMLIHTFITFISHINFTLPLSAYFIYGYFPLVVVGVYIGFSKTAAKMPIGLLLSVLYLLKRVLLGDLFDSDFRHTHLQHGVIIFVNLALLYCIIVAGSCAITDYFKKKFV